MSCACGSFTPLPSSGAARGAARVKAPFLPEAESPSTVAGPHELYRRPAVDSVPPPPLRGRSQLSAGCAGAHRLARRSAFHCVRSPHAARPAATASAFPPGARGTPIPRQVPPARVVSGFLFVCFCFFIMAIAPAALLPPRGFSLTKPPKRKGSQRGVERKRSPDAPLARVLGPRARVALVPGEPARPGLAPLPASGSAGVPVRLIPKCFLLLELL